MGVDGISGRVFYDAAIPGLTDVSTLTPLPTNPQGTKTYPSLTPAQSAANASAAGATSSTSSSSSNGMTNATNSLGKTAFLQLLVQEMTNQDPLKPADDTQFIAQLAQFSSLEQMQNMNQTLTSLVTNNQMSEAAAMLGKDVKAVVASTGATVQGVADQVMLNSGTVQVDVNGTPVNFSDITTVGTGSASGSTTTTGTASGA